MNSYAATHSEPLLWVYLHCILPTSNNIIWLKSVSCGCALNGGASKKLTKVHQLQYNGCKLSRSDVILDLILIGLLSSANGWMYDRGGNWIYRMFLYGDFYSSYKQELGPNGSMEPTWSFLSKHHWLNLICALLLASAGFRRKLCAGCTQRTC